MGAYTSGNTPGAPVKDLAGATINSEDYQRLVALCEHGVPLPVDFQEWTRWLEQAAEEADQLGLPVHPIHLDVEEFKRWTSDFGIRPCLEALRAFLIIKRYGGVPAHE